jgi:hypothetical protein
MSVYNVIGPAETIKEMLEKYSLEDTFPATTPGTRDVNVEVEVSEEDAFTDWCEAHGLDPTLVF